MNTETTAILLRLMAFAVAVLPLLIDNLRTGRATNANNLLLAAGGLAMLAADHFMGWSGRSLWATAAWIGFGAIGLLVLMAMRVVPGGVAKTMMALLPWFPSVSYLLVISIGFLLSALLGVVMRRDAPIALPFAVASLGVWLYDLSMSALA